MGVRLYGTWFSLFAKRVEIALKLKRVEYEWVEQDLDNKSEELLKLNPVHKKVPVLVHDGKPLAESLVILEYIDETWRGDASSILPNDPYERAQARFWAKFFDDKLLPAFGKAMLSQSQGEEERRKATEESQELFDVLEGEMKRNNVSTGNGKGFLDMSGTLVIYWVSVLQEVVGVELLTREKHPTTLAWADEALASSAYQEALPNKEQLLEVYRVRVPAMIAKVNAAK